MTDYVVGFYIQVAIPDPDKVTYLLKNRGTYHGC